MAVLKAYDVRSLGEYVENLESSYTANIKW